MPKIKNIIIFLAIGAVFVFIYLYFIRGAPEDTATLVSTPGSGIVPSGGIASSTSADNSAVARDFLTLLLSVKNIKLDDAIFSDNAFISLRDSSITLTPDGNEGRPNPFAPLGSDIIAQGEAPLTP